MTDKSTLTLGFTDMVFSDPSTMPIVLIGLNGSALKKGIIEADLVFSGMGNHFRNEEPQALSDVLRQIADRIGEEDQND